jgi:cell division protease FtsH
MNNLTKNLVLWLVIAMVLMAVFNNFAPEQNRAGKEIDYSVFLDEVERGSVEQVTIDGATIYIRGRNGERYVTYSPGDPGLVNDLLKADIVIKAQKEEEASLLMQIFISWFPLLLLVGVWIFFMRQMQGGGGRGALSFGKSKARMLTEDKNNVTFQDVAGVDEAKEEVGELVEFLRSRGKPRFRFSLSRVQILSKCSWGSAPHECGICLSRPRRTHPALFLSMRSTP